MDWLAFIASLVRSVAWPLALCVVAWILREELKGLLGRLEKVRHKDSEALFTRRYEAAAESRMGQVEASLPNPDTSDQTDDSLVEQAPESLEHTPTRTVLGLAAALVDYPEAAILAAWEEFEAAMRQRLAAERGAASAPISVLVSRLKASKVINDVDEMLIESMRILRNEVANEKAAVPTSTAFAYAKAVDQYLSKMQGTR